MTNQFLPVKYNTNLYWKAVRLREIVLRLPIGMRFSADQLRAESSELVFCIVDKYQNIIATNQFLITGNEAKMRQVATAIPYQGRGIGSSLYLQSESKLKDLDIHIVYCHARKPAILFYQKLGFEVCSEEFMEVGIPHQKMKKKLTT